MEVWSKGRSRDAVGYVLPDTARPIRIPNSRPYRVLGRVWGQEELPDRLPVRIWGLNPGCLLPSQLYITDYMYIYEYNNYAFACVVYML